MLDPEKIFQKANQDYMDYQRRSSATNTQVAPLSTAHKFVIKALIEEFYKDPRERSQKPNKNFLNFTKDNG